MPSLLPQVNVRLARTGYEWLTEHAAAIGHGRTDVLRALLAEYRLDPQLQGRVRARLKG